MQNQLIPVEVKNLNGKNISFRRLGHGKRKILFFHGFPGSSLQLEPFRAHLDAFDLEVICLDRPGYNQSQLTDDDQFAQATEAAFKLLRSLDWKNCQVVSVSGGTPFLFAFVRTYPKFVSKIDVICGLGPVGTKDFKKFLTWKANFALKILPHLPGSIFKKIVPKENGKLDSGKNVIRYFLPASRADLRAIQSPFTQQILSEALREAFLQNGEGPKRDAKAYLSPWSFDLNGYAGPVDIWHGDQDRILSPAMAKQTALSIPHARLHMMVGEGHYSLPINQIEAVLKN